MNGEAIYNTRPWKYQNDTINSNVWYTQNSGIVYAILLQFPSNQKVVLGAPTTSSSTKVSLLGFEGIINWSPTASGAGLTINLLPMSPVNAPCQWAWVFKLENVL